MNRQSANLPSPARIAAAGCIALAVAMGIGRFAFTPVLPLMQDDYALPIEQGAWLATANYLGYLAGAIVTMLFGLRATTAIRTGLALIAITTALMALNAGLAVWLVLRALAGAGSALVMVYVAAWTVERLRTRDPALNGAVFGGVGIGIACAGGIVGALTHFNAGSVSAWEVLGLLSVAGWLAINGTLGDATSNAPLQSTDRKHPRWNAQAIRIVCCFALAGFGYIVPASFIPVMAKQAVGDSPLFAWAWPLFGLAALASTFAASALTQHWRNRSIWAAGHLIMALGVALPALWPNLVAIIAAALLVGSTFMVVTMIAVREARALAGTDAVWLLSALTAAFATGQLAGPVCAAFLLRHGYGLSSSLALAAVLLAVSAIWLSVGKSESVSTSNVHGSEEP